MPSNISWFAVINTHYRFGWSSQILKPIYQRIKYISTNKGMKPITGSNKSVCFDGSVNNLCGVFLLFLDKWLVRGLLTVQLINHNCVT